MHLPDDINDLLRSAPEGESDNIEPATRALIMKMIDSVDGNTKGVFVVLNEGRVSYVTFGATCQCQITSILGEATMAIGHTLQNPHDTHQ